MSILLARVSHTNNIIQIDRIEQFVHTQICNAGVLISKSMIKTKNWKYSGKYFVSIIFASILLLSIFSILAHNEFASAVSNAQPNSNIKNINSKTEVNDKSVHVKSPPHIPPIILEQFLQSKICKNKCVHPKNP